MRQCLFIGTRFHIAGRHGGGEGRLAGTLLAPGWVHTSGDRRSEPLRSEPERLSTDSGTDSDVPFFNVDPRDMLRKLFLTIKFGNT